VREIGNQAQQPIAIFHSAESAVCFNDNIVPSRDHFSMFLFRWVPVWADVVLRPAENYECAGFMRVPGPLRIGASEVASQGSFRPGRGIIEHRKMAAFQSVRTVSDHRSEWMPANGILQNLASRLLKMCWIVHPLYSSLLKRCYSC